MGGRGLVEWFSRRDYLYSVPFGAIKLEIFDSIISVWFFKCR